MSFPIKNPVGLLSVTLLLILLVLRCAANVPASAQQCTSAGDAAYCFPWPDQNAARLSFVKMSADSTCGVGQDSVYFAGAGSSICRSGLAPVHVVSELRDGDYSVVSSRWQSAVLPSANTPVTITVEFSTLVYLTSFELRFGYTTPDRLLLWRSRNFGRTYDIGDALQFSKNCAAETNGLPCQPLPTAPQAGAAQYTFSTGSELWDAATNSTTQQNMKDRASATNLQIIFQKVGLPPGVSTSSNVDKYYYYTATELALGMVCDCNGHASACAPETGSCSCEHNTTGRSCDQCMAGWEGWREGTRTDPSPCQGQWTSQGGSELRKNFFTQAHILCKSIP